MARKAKADKDGSVEVTVFVPTGKVRRDEILRAALLVAQHEIAPAAIKVTPKITGASDVRTNDDGTEGRDYTVTITWTPRPTRAPTAAQEDQAEATVDKVLEGLEPLTAEKIVAATDTGEES
jgi:hypothetical protein